MTILLETERLILRTWEENDTKPMAEISSDPIVMQHFPALQDFEQTVQLINRIKSHYQQYGFCLNAVDIKASNTFIGFVGLNAPSFEIPHFTPQGLPVIEIGWRLAADHWGKGYATEAAKAVLHDAFMQHQLDEVISFTTVANIPSRAVMKKIGLQHNEKDDFDHPKLKKDSPYSKHVLYRLTREAYLQNSK